MINFTCPHCGGSVEKIDDRWFSYERVQSSDDLNADPLQDLRSKIELWYCCFCGKYFRVYYTINRISRLEEK